jgi:hypothetical protein
MKYSFSPTDPDISCYGLPLYTNFMTDSSTTTDLSY